MEYVSHGMPAFLEIWTPSAHQLLSLEEDRVAVGKASANELAVPSDTKMSRLHAVLERFASGWSLRDLGSRNGTFVNGERVLNERALKDGDEIVFGQTRVIYRADREGEASATEAAEPPPELTRRERDVLIALCRPLLAGDLFTEPASTSDVAVSLFVSEAAVKQHLSHLYDKFGIYGDGERRRVRLANDAIMRGAVSIADLRA